MAKFTKAETKVIESQEDTKAAEEAIRAAVEAEPTPVVPAPVAVPPKPYEPPKPRAVPKDVLGDVEAAVPEGAELLLLLRDGTTLRATTPIERVGGTAVVPLGRVRHYIPVAALVDIQYVAPRK